MSEPAKPAEIEQKVDVKDGQGEAQAQSQEEAQEAKKSKSALKNKARREKAKLKKQESKNTAPEDPEAEKQRLEEFKNLGMHKFFTGSTRLEYSKARGRHVVAARPFKPGEVVFETPAYAAVLMDPYVETHCHRCFKPLEVAYLCQECKFTRFCSPTCNLQMRQIHEAECKTLAKLPELNLDGDTSAFRMLIRMLHLRMLEQALQNKSEALKAQLRRNKAGKPVPSGPKWTPKPGLSWEDASSLVDHMDAVEPTERAAVLMALSKLESILDPKVRLPLDLCLRTIFKIQYNAHTIVDEMRRHIGVGLYPAAAYLNHSCRPTCVYQFGPNGTIEMRTIMNVAVGQELTYAYIDLYQVRKARWDSLRQRYEIQKCQCARCTESASTSVDRFLGGFVCPACKKALLAVPSTPSALSVAKCESKECGSEVRWTDLEAAEKEAKAILDRALGMWREGERKETKELLETKLLKAPVGQLLHPRHTIIFNAWLLLVACNRDLQNWPAMADACRNVIDRLNFLDLGNHPELADAYAALGEALSGQASAKELDAEARSALWKEAAAAYTQAHKLRVVCRGEGHPRTKEAKQEASKALRNAS